MKLYPIEELRTEHKGHVTLLNVKEWVRCAGQMGRPWRADESTDAQEQVCWIRWVGFTHFVLHSDLEAIERKFWQQFSSTRTLTDAEEQVLAEKYGRTV